MPKKGLTAVKVTFMTMTLVTLVTAVKFDYGTVQYSTVWRPPPYNLYGRGPGTPALASWPGGRGPDGGLPLT